MAEISFYHLLVQPIEEVLPNLVERSLTRDWRVHIASPNEATITSMDALLWSFRDDSFLPHSLASGEKNAEQPIMLSTATLNENDAHVCFLLDDADIPVDQNFQRIVYLFDGNDESNVVAARLCWKNLKSSGQDLAYWRQNDLAKWQKVS